MTTTRLIRYIPAIVAVAILLVLIARVVESSSLPTQEFIQIGLLYDKICYMGSYLIVCPDTAPPYEVILLILAALFVLTIWTVPVKQQRLNKK